MIKIKEVPVGFPAQQASALQVSFITAKTSDLTCNTYYQMFKTIPAVEEDQEPAYVALAEGNYELTEEEYAEWGVDNSALEDFVLKHLSLERI